MYELIVFENRREWFMARNFGYKNKIVHRVNGPAVEYFNGTKEWMLYGYLNRINNYLPTIEYSNGDKEYWVIGSVSHFEFKSLRHRDHGPAVIYGDKEFWFKHGEFIKCTN